MKLIALVKSLAAKAGIPETDTELQEILSNAAIQDVEIADKAANLINANLMSLAAAKANPDVRQELIGIGRKEAYDGMDAEINATMKELNISDDIQQKILAEKSTPKRAKLLATEVKRIEAENGGKNGDLVKQINDLNAKIGQAQQEKIEAVNAERSKYEDRILAQAIDFDLASFNYIFPKETPKTTVIAAAKASISRKMAEAGVKVIIDETTGVKKLVRLDGTEYYDKDHKAVTYNDFLTSALTGDNLLSAHDPKPDPVRNPTPPKVEGNPDKGDATFLAAADKNIENLEAAIKAGGDTI